MITRLFFGITISFYNYIFLLINQTLRMNPTELINFFEKLIKNNLNISTMIWGPPGIGKSSIVSAAADKAGIDFIDLRLSQLAPTDLRGLPVPVHPEEEKKQGTSKWYPPEFLPREG